MPSHVSLCTALDRSPFATSASAACNRWFAYALAPIRHPCISYINSPSPHVCKGTAVNTSFVAVQSELTMLLSSFGSHRMRLGEAKLVLGACEHAVRALLLSSVLLPGTFAPRAPGASLVSCARSGVLWVFFCSNSENSRLCQFRCQCLAELVVVLLLRHLDHRFQSVNALFGGRPCRRARR